MQGQNDAVKGNDVSDDRGGDGDGNRNRGDAGGLVPRHVGHVTPPAASPPDADPLISMIERAARDPSVDIDKMERLFQMHERMMERTAKTAYLAAFSKLQAELPAAIRGGTGHNSKKYARYEDIIESLRPILQRHGFSLSHRVDTSGNVIKVTGILGHANGHSEETQFTAPPDTSGGKVPIHAIASTISYGKRYVSLTLTGIATEDEDDDAKRAIAGPTIDEDQEIALRDELEAAGKSVQAFCAFFKLAKLGDLPVTRVEEAKAAIRRKK